jgi:hypothetical protein
MLMNEIFSQAAQRRHRHPEALAAPLERRMGNKRLLPFFETPRKSAAPEHDSGVVAPPTYVRGTQVKASAK